MLSIKRSMLYKVAQYPDKTFIGWTARGIDFLGFHLTSTDLTVAKTAFNRFVERIARLYEQGADAVRIGQYARRWLRKRSKRRVGRGTKPTI
jgi:hypothetical protein